MTARGVTDETLGTIQKCGIDLHHWLEGFKDTPSVSSCGCSRCHSARESLSCCAAYLFIFEALVLCMFILLDMLLALLPDSGVMA